MAKEFKTIDELVGLLESRHVKTDADTRTALMRESYYAVVNGYKDPFLDREAMQSSSGDVYVSGTCFSQIYDLYRLDRELRLALFPYLTEAEGIGKPDRKGMGPCRHAEIRSAASASAGPACGR